MSLSNYDLAGITVRTAKNAVTRPDFTCCDWLNH